jgi:pimeloyl-ACP methyl ester carboxylesterase
MKTTAVILFFLITSMIQSQSYEAIVGEWNGILNVQGSKLPLVLKVRETDEGLKATLDSPAQNAYGIQVNSISFDKDTLSFSVKTANIAYKGYLKDKVIRGEFTQGMFATSLDLRREKQELKKTQKPQEPKKPYPYHEEEVAFANEIDDITLAGTYTYPKDKNTSPAVILISGSGAQDRNSEILGHKPFLVIADYLTRKGVAVLRYDDRGTADSQGDFAKATSADFAEDAKAAIQFLASRPEIDVKKIGVIGHSEGGLIAPMLAEEETVSFLILIAPPVAPIDELMLLQQELVGEVAGMGPAEISMNREINKSLYTLLKNEKDDVLATKLDQYLESVVTEYPEIPKAAGISKEAYKQAMKEAYLDPWMLYFLRFDPKDNLTDLKLPFLALFGEKDLQVSAVQNASLLTDYALKNNSLNRIKTLKELNHLMQTSITGSPAEYAEIEETFSEKALLEIFKWMKEANIIKTQK